MAAGARRVVRRRHRRRHHGHRRARRRDRRRSRWALVFIALDGAAGTRVRRALFPGDRERIRHQSTQSALEMLRRGLLALPPL